MSAPGKKPRERLPEQVTLRPATERLNALLAKRQAGLIVPPPRLLPVDNAKTLHEQELDHQANVRTVLTWLQETAAKGASEDVENAWRHLTDKRVKGALYDQSRQLRLQADRHMHALMMEVQAEENAARREWQQRQQAAKLKHEIEVDEKALAAKKQRLVLLTS